MRALALILTMLATPALAQNQCRIPDSLPKARAEFPPPGNAVQGSITGYQLAMSWSPQFCRENGDEREHASRCEDQKFGFVLDSLRADGEGRKNPVYCKPMKAVPEAVARRSYCATPSVKLMSHVWAKYGSCIASDPGEYFDIGTAQFGKLKWPDINKLLQASLDVGAFLQAVATANPGTRPEMFAVRLTPLGWLEGLKLCLDAGRNPRACPAEAGGAGAGASMRIWPSY